MRRVLILAAWPELDRHDTGSWHPERPARVPAALSGIVDAGLADAVVPLEARPASRDELTLVHPDAYLQHLQQLCEGGGSVDDADTEVSVGSWETAVLAVGGVLTCVQALQQGHGDAAFAALRPPGHHATATEAMGFCLLNSIAVAAAKLAADGERVLVLDWDVHHGNGTQSIFWNDPRVLYVSTHQSPLYPGTGAVTDTGGPDAPGTTVNLPLPPGATGDVVRRALDEVAAPVVERFDPTWVLVSAGYDGHRRDPLSHFALTAGDFADLGRTAAGFAPGPGRTLLVLEGGYDLQALRMSVGASLAAVLGQRYRPEEPSSGGPGTGAVEAARRVHLV